MSGARICPHSRLALSPQLFDPDLLPRNELLQGDSDQVLLLDLAILEAGQFGGDQRQLSQQGRRYAMSHRPSLLAGFEAGATSRSPPCFPGGHMRHDRNGFACCGVERRGLIRKRKVHPVMRWGINRLFGDRFRKRRLATMDRRGCQTGSPAGARACLIGSRPETRYLPKKSSHLI
jgi:hypothetical protein